MAANAVAEQRPGIRLGAVGGVPVFLKPSWFLIAAVVTVLFAPTVRRELPELGGGATFAIGLSFAVLLLLSVFVHELAHAVAARATGTPATHIVLDLWGGHTAFAEESAGPWRSIGVAAVGPLSNGFLCLGAALVIVLLEPEGVPALLLVALAYANGVVAIFNALPGLPLDGGRVLEGLVWQVTGDRTTGTVVAGWCGRVVAVGVVVWVLRPLLSGESPSLAGSIWMLLIAWLLWQGAGGAIAYARWRRRAGLASAAELLRPAVSVPSTATLAEALAARGALAGGDVVVLDVYGRPASIVDAQAAADVPPARASAVAAAAVAHALPAGAVVEAALAGPALLERLQGSPASRYVVVDAAGAVVGVLDWDDVARFVSGR